MRCAKFRAANGVLLLTLRSGKFRKDSGTGLYDMGTLIWGDNCRVHDLLQRGWPTSSPRSPSLGGSRMSRGAPHTALRVQTSGACINSATERWTTFAREGVFGSREGADECERSSMEPNPLPPVTPYTMDRVMGVLTNRTVRTANRTATDVLRVEPICYGEDRLILRVSLNAGGAIPPPFFC